MKTANARNRRIVKRDSYDNHQHPMTAYDGMTGEGITTCVDLKVHSKDLGHHGHRNRMRCDVRRGHRKMSILSMIRVKFIKRKFLIR